jgi:transposase
MDDKFKALIIRLFYCNNKSPVETLRAYRRETGTKCELNELQIRRLVTKFEEEGTFSRKLGSGNPGIHENQNQTILNVNAGIAANHPYKMSSTRQIAAHGDVTVSHQTVWKVLKQYGMKAYHPTSVQALLPGDAELRLQFAQWMQGFEHLDKVFWSDESMFYLTPKVTNIVGVIWAHDNPYFQIPKKLHEEKIHVWGGFTAEVHCPPFFFDASVTSEVYLNVLQNHLVPFLRSRGKLRSTYFQQDGAPPHVGRNVKEFLQQTFPQRIISRCFEIPWPARSPDLTPMDFFYWGYIKQKVYTERFENVEQLKDKIRRVISEIDQEVLQHAVRSMPGRLARLVEIGGMQIK